MYLFITADCDVHKVENIDEGFELTINSELANIIDLSDPYNPIQYRPSKKAFQDIKVVAANAPKCLLRDYVKGKEILISELKDKFRLTRTFEGGNGGLSSCGNCGDSINIKRLPSVSWTSALYCWLCSSITIQYHADDMSGNHIDHYDVYRE
jgi:hypothetical protein